MKLFNQQKIDYGVKMINAISQWGETQGENINVAVLDTGIDYTHFELKDRVKGGANFTSSNINDYMDRNGHGTFCSGIISGANNRDGIVGIAPLSNLYSVKILGDNARGSLQWLAHGLVWCADNNIHIASMSLGYSQNIDELHDVIKYAYNKGVIMVAAAGNDRRGKVDFPAQYPEVIGVTAISKDFKLGDFCNNGSKVEIAAPGINVRSTYLNNGFTMMSGTSVATPHIAGAIALIQSKSLKVQNRLLTFDEIKQILFNHVKDLGAKGKDDQFGYGLFHF